MASSVHRPSISPLVYQSTSSPLTPKHIFFGHQFSLIMFKDLHHISLLYSTVSTIDPFTLFHHRAHVISQALVSSFLAPNSVVEWLTLLLCIREVSDSNIGPETSYPDRGFSWFPAVPPGECRKRALKLGHDCFLPHPFHLII
jgi:hypothetical protein